MSTHTLVARREAALRAAFYAEHIDAARSYAAYLTRDAHEAEDLASEAVWRTLRRLSAGMQVGHPRAYVKATVRNLVNDAARAKPAQVVSLETETVERLLGLDEHAPDPGDLAVLRIRVAEALDALAPRHAETLRLLYLEDLSPAEAAETLGITTNACGVLAHRARRAFAAAWAA